MNCEFEPENVEEIFRYTGVWYKPWTWLSWQKGYKIHKYELRSISLVTNPEKHCEFKYED